MRRSALLCFALVALPASAAAQTPEPPAAPSPEPPAAPPPAQAPGAPPAAPPGAPQPPPAYPPPQGYPQQPVKMGGDPPYPPAQPVYGQQGYPQQPYPPGYAPPPPVYGQPAYPQQPYPPGYGYVPEGPPPPPPPPKPTTLRWSLRFDPFDLVMRQLTFQGEVYIAGPFAIEIAPSWIFGSPYAGIDKKGVSIAANAVFYLQGTGLRGMWLKAHFAYENYSATLTHSVAPELVSQPTRFSSAILGAMFGDTFVIPRSGGFALSAGIGVGVATAGKTILSTPSDRARGLPAESTTLYDGFDKVRLLGTLGLGVAF